MFLKPECISDSVKKLKLLDFTDRNIQKAHKDLGVGKYAYADLNKARLNTKCQHWVERFYSGLKTGYIKAAKKILEMPFTIKL